MKKLIIQEPEALNEMNQLSSDSDSETPVPPRLENDESHLIDVNDKPRVSLTVSTARRHHGDHILRRSVEHIDVQNLVSTGNETEVKRPNQFDENEQSIAFKDDD